MSSSAPASDSESDELGRYVAGLFGPCYLPTSPAERRYSILFWHFVDETRRVRRWFVEKFPIYIREYVMTFVDQLTADPIAELELTIHHPQLTKARTRQLVRRLGDNMRG